MFNNRFSALYANEKKDVLCKPIPKKKTKSLKIRMSLQEFQTFEKVEKEVFPIPCYCSFTKDQCPNRDAFHVPERGRLCFNWINSGTCNKDKLCRCSNKHKDRIQNMYDSKLCFFAFIKGECNKGSDCRYEHPPE